MNKQELVDYLYLNFYDKKRNVIDLTGLDFSKYGCNIDFSYMAVAGEIKQNNQRAKVISQWGHKFERLNNYAIARHDDVESTRFYEKITRG